MSIAIADAGDEEAEERIETRFGVCAKCRSYTHHVKIGEDAIIVCMVHRAFHFAAGAAKHLKGRSASPDILKNLTECDPVYFNNKPLPIKDLGGGGLWRKPWRKEPRPGGNGPRESAA